MKRMVGILALSLFLSAATSSYAELTFVDDFEDRPIGNLIGATATAGGDGLWGVTNGTSTGNVQVATVDGSKVVTYMSVSPTGGTPGDGRGFSVYNLSDTIADTEKGVVFFRFNVDTSRAADTHIGLHTSTGAMNASGHRNNPQNYIIAGFRLFSDGSPAGTMNMVRSRDVSDVIESGLLRGQWYNCWIEADHTTDTFSVYLSEADGPAGLPPQPTSDDLVAQNIPFDTATTAHLAGIFFCSQSYASQSGASQRSTIQSATTRIDEFYWDGDEGLIMTSKKVQNPVPVHSATQVPIDQILSWDAPNDPNIAQIFGYDIYLDPNEADVAAGKLSVQVSTGQTPTAFDPIADFLFDMQYFWRVDVNVKLNDPNQTEMVVPGSVWTFTSESSAPVISQQPDRAVVSDGATVEFSVEVDSIFPPSYQWYKSSDSANNTFADDVLISGATNPTLTLSFVTAANEGFYYCKVSNPTVAFSNAAGLGVKRAMAHWTLDSLVNGQYEDSSGRGHHADPNGTPEFVPGANPALTNNGVVIDASNGWANAGTWDPSQYTGQLTCSLWVKWNGQLATPVFQGLIGKRNTWLTSNMMWQLEIANNAASLLAFKNLSYTVNSPILPLNEWEQVTVTVSGTTANVYRNGVGAVSGTFVFNTGAEAAVMLGAVGQDPALTIPTAPFNGILDDIRIYNYAMNAVEAAYLYADASGESVCVSPNNPVLTAYDFDGNCRVDLGDMVEMASHWLYDQLVP